MTTSQAAYLAGVIACELEERGYAGKDGFTTAALSNCSRSPDKLAVFFRHAVPKAARDTEVSALLDEFDPPPGPYPVADHGVFYIGYYHQKIARELPAALSERLAKLIAATGLSVSAWCKAHALSQQTVQGYISGARRPTWDMVQQLAKALGVPTDTFRDK